MTNITLRHLNDDTSWLIAFNDFKILLDPWFIGSQTDYFSYFSTQEHATPSSIQDIQRDLGMNIDAIVISHEFTDHCHEQTLRSLSSTIPIFATSNAAKRIRRWNHFQHVYNIPTLNDRPENFTIRTLSNQQVQTDTISVGYIPEKKIFSLPSLHGATCISFLVNNQQWHSLLYIPHGCEQSSICEWVNKQTNVKICVLLQGFDRVFNPIWLGGLLNYGCHQAAQLAIAIKAKYWLNTHDENKIARGLVSKFLKRDNHTIANAKIELDKYKTQTIIPQIHCVANGDSFVIDLTE
ncbi:hypothetical protein I4U23_011801 [Adineta vaga]|nr:hypothetical protein I4U23_011801 [Adineta vaga]